MEKSKQKNNKNFRADYTFDIHICEDLNGTPIHVELTRNLTFDEFKNYCNILKDMFKNLKISVRNINN